MRRSIANKSAYPIPPYFKMEDGKKVWRHGSSGVTIRQFYKAAALQSEFVSDISPDEDFDEVARIAGRLADAMIAEDEEYYRENSSGSDDSNGH